MKKPQVNNKKAYFLKVKVKPIYYVYRKKYLYL